MITLTVTYEQYQQVSQFKRPLVIERMPSVRTLEKRFTNHPLAKKKRAAIAQPMQVLNTETGEIKELRRVESGCGIHENDVRELKWFDEATQRTRGGITVICTDVVKYPEGDYRVTLEHTTKRRSVPLGADTLLAPVTGYTGDTASTIDEEASAMWSPEVAEFMADDEKARQERAKMKTALELRQMKERLDELDIDRRHKERVKRDISAALAELAYGDEEAA